MSSNKRRLEELEKRFSNGIRIVVRDGYNIEDVNRMFKIFGDDGRLLADGEYIVDKENITLRVVPFDD
jgi:hypothetical protein